MGLKRLIVGGIAFLALMYAAGCNQTTSNSVRDDKPAVTSTNRGSNKTIDDQIIPVPIGQNGNDNGHNGNGPDPLYTLVEETINLYNTKGEALDVEKKADIELYISLMSANLEKLANADLSKLNENSKRKLGDAFNDYGACFYTNGDFNKALALFMKALENRENAITHGNIGVTLCRLNRFKEALVSLNRSLELNPDYNIAKKWHPYALKKASQ